MNRTDVLILIQYLGEEVLRRRSPPEGGVQELVHVYAQVLHVRGGVRAASFSSNDISGVLHLAFFGL